MHTTPDWRSAPSRRLTRPVPTVCIVLLVLHSARAMDIDWSRPTGRWPVDAAPLIADLDGDGTPEILAVNRGGELLAWKPDGTPLPRGADGLMGQLLEGQWTSTPALMPGPSPARLMFGSVDGLVVGIDRDGKPVWRHQLPGKTATGRCTPVAAVWEGEPAYCVTDESGSVTLIRQDGRVAWEKNLQSGPCRAPPQLVSIVPERPMLLVPAGSTLNVLDQDGKALWKRDLGGEIRSRPLIIASPDQNVIVCAAILRRAADPGAAALPQASRTGASTLFALGFDGQIVWQTQLGDQIDVPLSIRPIGASAPWIICSGVLGNLHAVDSGGFRLWVHEYESEGPGAPLVFDTNRDGNPEILVAARRQHVDVFNRHGYGFDDVRIDGLPTANPVPIRDPAEKVPRILIATDAKLLYCLRVGAPMPPEPTPDQDGAVKLQVLSGDSGLPSGISVQNPGGRFINAAIAAIRPEGWSQIRGRLTQERSVNVPLPVVNTQGPAVVHATVYDFTGPLLASRDWTQESGTEKK